MHISHVIIALGDISPFATFAQSPTISNLSPLRLSNATVIPDVSSDPEMQLEEYESVVPHPVRQTPIPPATATATAMISHSPLHSPTSAITQNILSTSDGKSPTIKSGETANPRSLLPVEQVISSNSDIDTAYRRLSLSPEIITRTYSRRISLASYSSRRKNSDMSVVMVGDEPKLSPSLQRRLTVLQRTYTPDNMPMDTTTLSPLSPDTKPGTIM